MSIVPPTLAGAFTHPTGQGCACHWAAPRGQDVSDLCLCPQVQKDCLAMTSGWAVTSVGPFLALAEGGGSSVTHGERGCVAVLPVWPTLF